MIFVGIFLRSEKIFSQWMAVKNILTYSGKESAHVLNLNQLLLGTNSYDALSSQSGEW